MGEINKKPKARTLECVICGLKFTKNISPSDIKSGRGKVCSKRCRSDLNSVYKTKGSWRICERCGGKFWAKPSEDRRGCKRKYCSYKCYQPTPSGKAISIDGYYVINGKKVHRMIMEEYLGRKLKSNEIVHHINEDRFDNRLENLQLVTRSQHNKIHRFLE